MDKKYLTKFNAIILVIFLTVILLISGCSCNPFDNGSKAFLTKQMDKLQPEVTGYKIIKIDSTEKNRISSFEGTVTVKKVEVNIKKGEGKNVEDYIINYNDKEKHINNEYMREKSNAYVYIHDIWKRWKNKAWQYTYKSEIYGVGEFDNKLFIVTQGTVYRIASCIEGMIPITLYEFNIETEEVLYAGYYKDYADYQMSVAIAKTEEK